MNTMKSNRVEQPVRKVKRLAERGKKTLQKCGRAISSGGGGEQWCRGNIVWQYGSA